jgi:hypothetical protein
MQADGWWWDDAGADQQDDPPRLLREMLQPAVLAKGELLTLECGRGHRIDQLAAQQDSGAL